MKSGLDTHGYTIIEVMIVLAISSALLLGIMLGIAGQQRKTEFTQSVNDFQAQISDVINTVSTGYAVNTANFACVKSATGPQLSPGSNTQGQNQDCIILGRAVQLAVLPDTSAYNLYTVLGLRQTAAGKEPTDISQTFPTVAAASNGGANSFESGQIQNGVTVTEMYYTTDGTLGTRQDIGTIAFLSSLGKYTGCTDLCSGGTTVQLYAVDGISSGLGLAESSVSKRETSPISDSPDGINKTNLKPITGLGSVVICLKSGGTDQYGVITIGSNNRQLSSKLEIMSSANAKAGKCP